MKKTVWLLVCSLACFSIWSCAKQEGSQETTTQEEPAQAEGDVALVGTWQITEWKADHVDQMEMWRVGDLKVEFRADGSIESQLVYSNGDERSSAGTWKRNGDNVEVVIKGEGEEGDEPFERTREFTIDELSADVFAVHGEIGPAEKPIVLTYKGQRIAGSGY